MEMTTAAAKVNGLITFVEGEGTTWGDKAQGGYFYGYDLFSDSGAYLHSFMMPSERHTEILTADLDPAFQSSSQGCTHDRRYLRQARQNWDYANNRWAADGRAEFETEAWAMIDNAPPISDAMQAEAEERDVNENLLIQLLPGALWLNLVLDWSAYADLIERHGSLVRLTIKGVQYARFYQSNEWQLR